MNQSIIVMMSVWPGPRLNSPNTGGIPGACWAPRPLKGPGARDVASRGGPRAPNHSKCIASEKNSARVLYCDGVVKISDRNTYFASLC